MERSSPSTVSQLASRDAMMAEVASADSPALATAVSLPVCVAMYVVQGLLFDALVLQGLEGLVRGACS
eukprot:13501373-Alexandrium_andersonii.AAC.1